MYKFTKDRIKNFFKKFFLINDTPHKIAAGVALGVFLGIVPGEGVICTLLLATLFGFNRLAATAGVLAVNMWTTVFILPLAAGAGAFVFGKNYTDLVSQFNGMDGNFMQLFFSKIFFFHITLPLLAGFFIVAGLIALVIYFGLFVLLVNHRKNKKELHLFGKKLGKHEDRSLLDNFLKSRKKKSLTDNEKSKLT